MASSVISARNNVCQVWIGGSDNDRYDYPYRLITANRITPRLRSATQQLMLDSDIGNAETTNREILDAAIEYDAQFVVPKDYPGDVHRTQESLEEFVELYKESLCGATVIFPVQPPHDEHLQTYSDFFDSVSHIGIGGLKQESPEVQLTTAETVREIVGHHTWIHGFGMGCSLDVIRTLRNNPHLLDSIDVSTFERLPGLNRVADATWEQNEFYFPSGENRSTLSGIAAELMIYMLNYQLTSFCDHPSSQSKTEEKQSKLTQNWTTTSDATSSQ